MKIMVLVMMIVMIKMIMMMMKIIIMMQNADFGLSGVHSSSHSSLICFQIQMVTLIMVTVMMIMIMVLSIRQRTAVMAVTTSLILCIVLMVAIYGNYGFYGK